MKHRVEQAQNPPREDVYVRMAPTQESVAKAI